jgi:radical SAM protein with 4Fe4S-binding SPASM domain
MKLPEMPGAKLSSLVREAADLGCRSLFLTGGEPLLRPDIESILASATELGLSTALITNGWLLDETRARVLKARGLSRMLFSLDCLDSEVAATLRAPGHPARVQEAVGHAVKAGLRVELISVVTRSSLASAEELVRFASGVGAAQVRFFAFTPMGRGRTLRQEWMGPTEHADAVQQLADRLRALPGMISPMPHISLQLGMLAWSTLGSGAGLAEGYRLDCLARRRTFRHLFIRCDGEIHRCPLTSGIFPAIGNVFETPLKAALLEARARDARIEPPAPASGCLDCLHYDRCGVGCPVYAELARGGTRTGDPRCLPGEVVPLCPTHEIQIPASPRRRRT